MAVLNRYGRFVFLYCAQVIRFRRSFRVIEWEGFQAGSFKLQTDKGERSEGVEKTVVVGRLFYLENCSIMGFPYRRTNSIDRASS